MPKRVGFLYERLLDRELIKRSIYKGAKGKHHRRDVRKVLADVDGYVERMVEIVETRSFTPRQPTRRRLYDPSAAKWRDIASIPFFPDGIMHQITVEAMRDILMRGMSPWSCASVPGRGGARARKRAKKIIQKDPKGTKYGMEVDIRRYYPSIPLEPLLEALERKIKDKTFLLLVMVETTCYPSGMTGAMAQGLTARDLARGRVGIEIGFYIDQWLANFFLETADHLLERHPGVKYEIRYMDNFSLFGPNKRKLHRSREALEQHLLEVLGVRMKDNWQLYPIRRRKGEKRRHRMFAIVGYRIDLDTVILRKRNFLRLTRQSRKIQKRQRLGLEITPRQAGGFLSRAGQLKHCTNRTIREKYIKPVDTKQLKAIVRNHNKAKTRR